MPAAAIHADYKRVVDGIAEGQEKCTAVGARFSGLWRDIWDKLEDVGLDSGVSVM